MKKHEFKKCAGYGRVGSCCDPSVEHCELCGEKKLDCENKNK